MKENIVELVADMRAGNERSLAHLITLVEEDSAYSTKIMEMLTPYLGGAYIVGITGPMGSGKSTLIDRLTAVFRSKNISTGIVAIDPSSYFSGGAVLGDRIRMQQHYLDTDVFIRSMGTRGCAGGLCNSIVSVVKLLDAFGKDTILVETVGVGQTDVAVRNVADTVITVLTPQSGDSIQFMKAGLIEIADIVVINKADQNGANEIVAEINATLRANSRKSKWQIPVLCTQAIDNTGIPELYEEIRRHKKLIKNRQL
jgi:LAO/AO transport system kinase